MIDQFASADTIDAHMHARDHEGGVPTDCALTLQSDSPMWRVREALSIASSKGPDCAIS
jgi:hypothetical protein